METNKKIGIWIRVSTDMQAQGDSPEHHEKRARLYAEAKGWEVEVIYHLEAVSGKSVLDHPEAKKMLSDIKKGTISGIIFSKLARVARNTMELLQIADHFRNSNGDLISLHESIDTSSPAGRLFYTMIAAMAQWEREEIADRVAASVPIRAKLGKPLGGQTSYGYKWQSESSEVGGKKVKSNYQFVIDETEAPVRKLIYELFLKSKRKRTTADQLNQMGYRTRNGSKFSDTTVDRLLRDSSAKGSRLTNYTKTKDGSRNWALKAQSDWVWSPCPAIVSEDLWNECNRILDEQGKKRKKPGPRPAYLLAGFIHCQSCDKKMYVYHERKNKNYTCKACKIRILEEDINAIYHDQLKSFLLTDRDVSEYLEQSDSFIKDREAQVVILETESKNLQRDMDDLVKMRLSRELTPESFQKHYKPKEERLSQIMDQLPEVEAEIDFLRIQRISSDTILQDAKDLYERWPQLSFEDKRGIVEIITERITIGKEDIGISLAHLPSSLNAGKSQHDFRDSYLPPT